MALDRPAPNLAAESNQLGPELAELGLEMVDLAQGDFDKLTPSRAQLGLIEMSLSVKVEQVASEGGDALVE